MTMNDALFNIKVDKPIDSKLLEIKDGKYVVKGILPYIIRRSLNRGENFVGIVTGKTRCQTKGSKVLMANGEWNNIENIKIGDEVISPQKDGSNKFAKVIDTHKTKAQIYNVYDKENKLLYRCADNHEIPISYVHKGKIRYFSYPAEVLNTLNKQRLFTIRFKENQQYRIGINLKKSKKEMAYGFTLDSSSHWYITDNWMITKNSGKSFSALRLAMEIDPNFTIDNVVFSAKEFMELLHSKKLKQGSMVIWDEAGVGIATRDWYSILNKSINYVLQTWGHQNIGLILTVPDFSFIDSQTRRLVNMWFKTVKLVRSRNVAVMKVYHLSPMESAEPKKVRPRYTICGKKLDIEYIEVKKPNAKVVNTYLKKKERFTAKLNEEVLFDIQQFEKAKLNEQVKIVSDEEMLERAWNLLKDDIVIKAGKRKISAYIVKKKLDITISRAMYVQIKLLEKAEKEQYPPLESEKIYNEVEEINGFDKLDPSKYI